VLLPLAIIDHLMILMTKMKTTRMMIKSDLF
jgi:hypothetical protein